MKEIGSNLLVVPSYQSGFVEGVSTQKNITLVMHSVLANSRSPSKREIMVLFDIKKAFDSVCRPLLWQILKDNAKTPEEKHIVELIIQLHSEHTIYVDEVTNFQANRGLL